MEEADGQAMQPQSLVQKYTSVRLCRTGAIAYLRSFVRYCSSSVCGKNPSQINITNATKLHEVTPLLRSLKKTADRTESQDVL